METRYRMGHLLTLLCCVRSSERTRIEMRINAEGELAVQSRRISKSPRRWRRIVALSTLATGMALGAISANVYAQGIDATNWGSVVAPTFGTSEAGIYAGAE